MTAKAFQKLRIWQESYRLTLDVYRASESFPREEEFGLKSQIRRSASSVSANIAEGDGRLSDGDKRRCLSIARGSAQETAFHIMLARDLAYIEKHPANALIERYAGLAAGISSFMIVLDKKK